MSLRTKCMLPLAADFVNTSAKKCFCFAATIVSFLSFRLRFCNLFIILSEPSYVKDFENYFAATLATSSPFGSATLPAATGSYYGHVHRECQVVPRVFFATVSTPHLSHPTAKHFGLATRGILPAA